MAVPPTTKVMGFHAKHTLRQTKLASPKAGRGEVKALKRVLDSGWWASGPEAYKFENDFKEYLGTEKHCISVNSGTSALHLIGKVMDLPAGSEIIMPAITFISTAYMATYNGLTPVFADVNSGDLNLSASDLEKRITPKTRAVAVVHYGGTPADMDEIMRVAKKHNLYVIEDCAHAAGATYKGMKAGTIGDASIFSFQATKNLPCGDGGMIVTGRDDWDKRLRVLRKFGMNRGTFERVTDNRYSWDYDIVEEGYKYEMPDLLACIGREQLKKLDKHNKIRKQQASYYHQELGLLPELITQRSHHDRESVFYNYHIKVAKERRDGLMERLRGEGVHTSVHFRPLYLHTAMRGYASNCPNSEEAYKTIINLPIHPRLTRREQDKIIRKLTE